MYKKTMTNVVEIEIKTFELVFFMLKHDIKTYESAVNKQWLSGIKIYYNKINNVFSQIDDIKKTIFGSIKQHDEMIDIMKTGANVVTPDSFKLRYNEERKVIMSLLKTLKSSSFELEMYQLGFKEFMDQDTMFDEGITRRANDDGELEYYKISDDGTEERFNPYGTMGVILN